MRKPLTINKLTHVTKDELVKYVGEMQFDIDKLYARVKSLQDDSIVTHTYLEAYNKVMGDSFKEIVRTLHQINKKMYMDNKELWEKTKSKK